MLACLTGLARMLKTGGLRLLAHWLRQRLAGQDAMTVQFEGTTLSVPSDPRSFRYNMDAIAKLQRLVDAVALDDVEVVMDVGANRGHFAALALARWPQARVYAFEPSERMARQITGSLGDKVVLVREALGDGEGERAFFVKSGAEQASSLIRESVEWFAPQGDVHVETVRATTLDEFCSREGIARIDVLKVDIQGGESALLRGAPRMIRQTRCALVEASFLDPDPMLVSRILDEVFARRRVVDFVLSGADIAYDQPRVPLG